MDAKSEPCAASANAETKTTAFTPTAVTQNDALLLAYVLLNQKGTVEVHPMAPSTLQLFFQR
jgi:hypothetical protein